MPSPSRGFAAKPWRRRCCSCSASPPCSSTLGASASAVGARAARLFGRARDCGGRRHHRHGPALSRADADRAVDAREAHGDGQAGRLVGRLSDGACLRARLDALHRPDPCRDPGGRGLRGDRRQRRRHARRLFARAWHPVYCRGLRDRAVRRLPHALSRAISAWSRKRWAGCWFSPASRSSPARSRRQASGCSRRFRCWARSASVIPGRADGASPEAHNHRSDRTI